MMNFFTLLETIPSFIQDMEADWEMVTDYVFAQYRQPTYTEWVLIEKVFDETIG